MWLGHVKKSLSKPLSYSQLKKRKCNRERPKLIFEDNVKKNIKKLKSFDKKYRGQLKTADQAKI